MLQFLKSKNLLLYLKLILFSIFELFSFFFLCVTALKKKSLRGGSSTLEWETFGLWKAFRFRIGPSNRASIGNRRASSAVIGGGTDETWAWIPRVHKARIASRPCRSAVPVRSPCGPYAVLLLRTAVHSSHVQHSPDSWLRESQVHSKTRISRKMIRIVKSDTWILENSAVILRISP